MESFTVPSRVLIPTAKSGDLLPAMIPIVWAIASEVDRKRIPKDNDDGVWIEIPSRRLRNPDGRQDNVWLRQCLERLTEMKLSGEYKDDKWGAVFLAEYHFQQNGSLTRLFIPPAAVRAISMPETFARIEVAAAYKLKGYARRLYAALADRKRQTKRPYWVYPLNELRIILSTEERYERWANLRRHVLLPAVEEINEYGTVSLQMKPEKTGRTITHVRFDWEWKDIDQARITDEENDRHSSARNKTSDGKAPPLTDRERDAQKLDADLKQWLEENPGESAGKFLAERLRQDGREG